MTLKQAKRHLLFFRISLALAILLSAVSILSFCAAQLLTEYRYDTLIEQVQDKTLWKNNCIAAVKLSPRKPDAYMTLLGIYAEDGIFSNAENEEFFTLYNGSRARMNKQSDKYMDLQRTIGFLYMNCFEANGATRLRMALPYLEAAKENPKAAGEAYPIIQCYCRIGSCYRSYLWGANTEQQIPKEETAAVMDSIRQAMDVFVADTSQSGSFNSLGFCLTVGNFLYDFRNQLPAVADYREAVEMLDWIYKTLPQISALQSEQNKELMTYLQDNEKTIRKMIAWEFGEEWQQ